MKNRTNLNPTLLLGLLFALWAIVSLFTAAFTELSADETYYWFVSQNLDWGYFDHPPLFAIFAKIGVALFGDTPLGVRFMTAIAMPVALFLFWFVVRGDKVSVKNAVVYFMASFSVPILHLYGFVATPDTPLIFATVITLVAFKFYIDGRLFSVLLMGIGFAMMAYAKYHGVLVVMMIVASRPKMLLDWRFYLSSLIALALFLPHLDWQMSHQWVSFRYHLIDRSSVFEWRLVWEYFGNFIGTFNPLLVLPFMILLFKKQRVRAPMMRTMKFLFWGFFLFFLFSTSRGHVQPQWIIVTVLPMLFLITRACATALRLARYVINSSFCLGILLLGVHIFAIINDKDFLPQADIFGNRAVIEASQAQFANVDMIITSGSYQNASKLNFYGKIPSYAMPNIYSRSSQYEFVDMDTPMYGHKVALEVGSKEYRAYDFDSLLVRHHYADMPHKGYIFFDIIEHYIPTRKVRVEIETFPAKVLTDSRLALLLHIHNPYDFDIPLGGKAGFDIVMSLSRKGEMIDLPLPFKEQILGANGTLNIATTVTIPTVETAEFKVGITLRKAPYDSWYNSDTYTLGIINPKTRI